MLCVRFILIYRALWQVSRWASRRKQTLTGQFGIYEPQIAPELAYPLAQTVVEVVHGGDRPMQLGQAIQGLAPEVQIVLIVCLFALAVMILMILFLIIADRRKMQTAMKGTDQVTRSIARLRKTEVSKSAPDSSDL